MRSLLELFLSVGSFADDPTICDRCKVVLKGEFEL